MEINRRTFLMRAGAGSAALAALPLLLQAAEQQAHAEDIGFRPAALLKSSTTDTGQPLEFPAGPNEITAFVVELAPGGKHDRHLHPVPIFAYVLEGTLTLAVEGHGEKTYPAGTAHLEPVNTWHMDLNRGQISVKWVAVFMGQKGKPFVISGPKLG
jgi:quercetin dioxygenase-like cupin family protein